MGFAIVWLVNAVIGLIIFIVIAQAVVSLLIAFDVLNRRNRVVGQIAYMLERLTDPLLRPLRRFIPTLGGIDVTPIVLILGLQFLQILFNRTLAPSLTAALG